MSLSDYEKQVEIADRYLGQKDVWGPGTITQLVRDIKAFDAAFPTPETKDATMKFSKGISTLSKRGYIVLRRRTSKKRTLIISRDTAMAHLAAQFQNVV